jgi:tetratricopeptide (TPR) repeat protein
MDANMSCRAVFQSLVLAAVVASLAWPAAARIPKALRPQAEICLADPTPSCLLDVARALIQEEPRDPIAVDMILPEMADLYFRIGNFEAGADLASHLDSAGLLFLVEDHPGLRDADPAALAPIATAAEKLLADAGREPFPAEQLVMKAEVARILAAAGRGDRAVEVLGEAMATLEACIAAKDATMMSAARNLADAAARLQEPALAEALARAMYGSKWMVDPVPALPMEEVDEAAVGRALAASGRIEAATAIWQRIGAPRVRAFGLTEAIVLSKVRSGDLPGALEFIGGLPRQHCEGDPESRRSTVSRVIVELVWAGQMSDAERVLPAIDDTWSRDNQRTYIANAYLHEGDIDGAERMLADFSDPGGRANVQIGLASALGRSGDMEAALRAAKAAAQSLQAETDPARQAILGLHIALLHAIAGDADGARAAGAAALARLDELGDPFAGNIDPEIYLRAADVEAALHVRLGDPEDTNTVVNRFSPDGLVSEEDRLVLRLGAAAVLASNGEHALAEGLVTSVLRRIYGDDEESGLDPTFAAFAAARALAGLSLMP